MSWAAALSAATDLSEFVDPYLYPDSRVLRNLLELRDDAALQSAEADLSEFRRAQMAERSISVTGDFAQLRAIHRHLFQDVYGWAGELRTVDIRKGYEPSAEFFMPVSRLESAAAFTFRNLAEDRFLRNLPRSRFVQRLAHHYERVNYLHPFREGNGRAQRVFWSQIATVAGYDLDWRVSTGDMNDNACKAAMVTRDLSGLEDMFELVVQDRRVWLAE